MQADEQQNGDDNVFMFGEFSGDGSCPGDGGVLLQRLWDGSRWKQLRNCPGRYSCRVKPAAQQQPVQMLQHVFGEELNATMIAMHFSFSAAGKDPITVLRFADGGGLLSYDKGEGVFVHTLNTESGLCRKLIAMRIDPFSATCRDELVNTCKLAATSISTRNEASDGWRRLAIAMFRIHLHVLRYLEEDMLNEVAAAVCASVGRGLWRSSAAT